MSDIKYMKLKTYSPNMALLHGKPKTRVDKIIQLRSKDVHTELEFSERYGGISFSATMADDCKCARFKKIAYSHPERWKTVLIPVTAEQEALMFAKACELADVSMEEFLYWGAFEYVKRYGVYGCLYGVDAVKYDLAGVTFGFISHRKIWKPSATKNWCTETCFIVLLKGFANILDFRNSEGYYDASVDIGTGKVGVCATTKTLRPHDLQPTQGDEIARNYFK